MLVSLPFANVHNSIIISYATLLSHIALIPSSLFCQGLRWWNWKSLVGLYVCYMRKQRIWSFIVRRKKNIWLALVTRHSNISKILLCFRKGSLYIFSLSRSKDRGAHWHKNTGSGKYSLSLMTKTFLNAVSAANSPGMRWEHVFPLLLIRSFVTTATPRFALTINKHTGLSWQWRS